MNPIEALISLLMDNIVFVVIIFMVVSTIVKNIRNAQPGAPKPPRNAMPPFGGEVFTGPSELPRRQHEEEERQEQPILVQESVPEPEQSTPAAAAHRAEKRPPAPQPADSASFLSAKNAAEGMMWSEVFGPPRALKPHRARRK